MAPGLRRAAFLGAAWSLAGAWGVRLITLGHFVVIARLLEPVDLGIIAFATALVASLAGLVDQGFSTLLESRPDADEPTLDTAWWATSLVATVMTVMLALGAPWVAGWTGKAYLEDLLPWMALTIVLGAVSTIPLAVLRARFQHRGVATAQLIGTLAGAFIGIGCALAGWAYWSLVAKALVEVSLVSVVLMHLCPWRPAMRFDMRAWRRLLHEGAPILGMRLLDIVNQRLDALLIGARLGAVPLGFYTTGQRMYQIAMEAIFSAVNQVSLPLFGRVAGQPARTADVLLRLLRCISLLSFPAFALLAATGPDLVSLVFGERWRAAGPVLSALACGGLLFSVSYFNAPLMIANGRSRAVFGLTLVNALTNGLAFLAAVPYGIVAVAAAYAARGWLVYPLNLWLLRTTCGISLAAYGRALVPAAAGSAAAAAAAWAVSQALAGHTLLPRLGAAWAAGAVAHLLVLGTLFRRPVLAAISELRLALRPRSAAPLP
jgi:O-antigen/teichoic acid export membrane protein